MSEAEIVPLLSRTVSLDDDTALLDWLPGPPSRAGGSSSAGSTGGAGGADTGAHSPTGWDAAVVSWLRGGDGFVGWGEAARVDTHGSQRFDAADEWWRKQAAVIDVDDEVRQPGTGPIAMGSFAFAEHSAAGGTLIVPQVVIGRAAGRTWLTTTTPHKTAPPRPQPDPARAEGPDGGHVTFSSGALGTEEWQRTVMRAVAAMRRGEAEKVVLARDVVAHSERDLDLRRLLQHLAESYPSCWTFAADGLIGATPELLAHRQEGKATCRVLAGTIPRARGEEADAALASSAKDRREHELALDSVTAALRPFAKQIEASVEPFVLELPNVLHLASDVTAHLSHQPNQPAPTSLQLAAALHPTAAVCGTPTPVAARLLAELEGMDRGRYAGPVGWMDATGDGQWGIALRCGQLTGPRSARLFAGCGIMADSDAEAELAESEAKLAPMVGALGAAVKEPVCVF